MWSYRAGPGTGKSLDRGVYFADPKEESHIIHREECGRNVLQSFTCMLRDDMAYNCSHHRAFEIVFPGLYMAISPSLSLNTVLQNSAWKIQYDTSEH